MHRADVKSYHPLPPRWKNIVLHAHISNTSPSSHCMSVPPRVRGKIWREGLLQRCGPYVVLVIKLSTKRVYRYPRYKKSLNTANHEEDIDVALGNTSTPSVRFLVAPDRRIAKRGTSRLFEGKFRYTINIFPFGILYLLRSQGASNETFRDPILENI